MDERIKQVRTNAKLTQTEFADKLGLTKNYISLVENGNREPSDRTINDICDKFGVNPVWLRTGEGEPFVPLTRSEELAAIFEKVEVGEDAKSRLIRALARMPDEAFPTLLELALNIAKELAEE